MRMQERVLMCVCVCFFLDKQKISEELLRQQSFKEFRGYRSRTVSTRAFFFVLFIFIFCSFWLLSKFKFLSQVPQGPCGYHKWKRKLSIRETEKALPWPNNSQKLSALLSTFNSELCSDSHSLSFARSLSGFSCLGLYLLGFNTIFTVSQDSLPP